VNARPAHVVVVGGGRGIGAAIARRLAAEPDVADVTVGDLDEDAARAVAAALPGGRAIGVDVADPASVASLIEATENASRVAIAAGVFHTSGSLEVRPEDFERLLAVNLIGVYEVARGYAERMCARGDGTIVAVASIAATLPRLRQAAYCASKAGMRQALRVLALETVPAGVRINTVSPGPTDTPMMRDLARDHASIDDLATGSSDSFRPRIPDGRVARPGDIAEAVAFLLSPRSAHIAMRDVVVDGGELLGV
jgi:2,3-dihydro-2,3-dihydroxybenzoate dehydrogenase